ncbi:2-deoxy-scyllo-inosose synthase [Clostridium botulinum]|uniref:Putative 3-dehydroquinate synthase n=1 Tax=Clostridium botulinum (strain Langeland / NCTC 10281 / Type F) TaxID=441772 RepID=A7GF83_CLOBL|nr:2-deoxy-scyllo-inosose synthase [Clostridium botulinum]ABS39378.1 putative 3-dehydroquinate synthase [Clostridium botulinum F str. Langeland]KKM42580.1 3-dehydroquinate synthase [Clostridium botulinum]MBY6794143.1 3-dehydroquinate synthase [Clostridium botulinum]MBY6937142.1 3-dehydroquinate synthase [Clostridium botulinum]MBY6944562.1 3-dehydroquinate synthase [Clostridium botulinum]
MYMNLAQKINDDYYHPEVKLETNLLESSPIYLGCNIWRESLLEKMMDLNTDKFFLITDDVVYNLFGKELLEYMNRKVSVKLIKLPSGEKHKNIKVFNDLMEDLFDNNVTKSSILISLGGGVVGNITGLAAALAFRGIRFFHIPTTFMSQTDSILSRKQGINSFYGKNMIGSYYTSLFNFIDTSFLTFDSERFIRGSFVETVKNGFIYNADFLNKLKSVIKNDFNVNQEGIFNLVKMSIESKLPIMKADPTEKGLAMILEYGHTVGHAIEKLSYGKLSHGESVSIGMMVAARISEKLGYLSKQDVKEHMDILSALKTPTKIPSNIKISDIINRIKLDNKKDINGIRFVVLQNIGKCINTDGSYMIKVPFNIINEAIEETC